MTNLISSEILNCFINLIKSNSVNKTIKISNFGSFYYKKTPTSRSNPKTKETFPIPARSKLTFLSSNKVKELLIKMVGMAGFEPTTTTPPV